MTDAPDLPGVVATDAQAELDRLNAQVTTMRTVLTQLLQDVVRAERQVEEGRAAQLLEANERLMVSALGAITDAELANVARDKASQTGGLDPLTGLPTRAVLLDRLESAIFNSKRHGNRVALLFLDLDGFKQVNDERGHDAGDQLLVEVARRLRAHVADGDTTARLGGDEFAVVVPGPPEASQTVAARLLASLEAPYVLRDGSSARVGASIGVASLCDDDRGIWGIEEVLRRADAAMYTAKRRGGSSRPRASRWPASSVARRHRRGPLSADPSLQPRNCDRTRR